jgi:hypothetical protein
MLGLSYLGKTAIAQIGTDHFAVTVKEKVVTTSKGVLANISFIIRESLEAIEHSVFASFLAGVVVVKEYLKTVEWLKPVLIKFPIKNFITTSEKIRNIQFARVREFMRVRQYFVSHLIVIVVRNFFKVTNKLDQFIDGVKKLWERVLKKRGEY